MKNQKKTKEFLKARLAELSHEIEEIDHTLREPDNADTEERATENEDDEVLEGLGNQALGEISQIEAALKRIDLGTYGQCTECGNDISEPRLEAMPYAAKCIDCAALDEAST